MEMNSSTSGEFYAQFGYYPTEEGHVWDNMNSQEQFDFLAREVKRQHDLIHTPHTQAFIEALPLEAAFQIDHWGTEHDAGKEPQDYYWLLGYLSGKALRSAIDLEKTYQRTQVIDNYVKDKALHHTISSAAVLLNWHRRIAGDDTLFQPGTDGQ